MPSALSNTALAPFVLPTLCPAPSSPERMATFPPSSILAIMSLATVLPCSSKFTVIFPSRWPPASARASPSTPGPRLITGMSASLAATIPGIRFVPSIGDRIMASKSIVTIVFNASSWPCASSSASASKTSASMPRSLAASS